jgi:hypothetical protein
MIQTPRTESRTTIPPTATPILAPRGKEEFEGVYVPEGVALGVVMLTGVVEKRDPWRDIVLPGMGCCSHAPLRAVTKLLV